MPPKVAIIILNYNSWKDTIECLESVLRNNYSNYQVILIDNDSSNNSMEYIKSWAEGKQKILTPEPSHPLYSLSHPPIKKPIPYIYYTREEAENGGKIELEEKFQNANFQNSTTKYPLIFIQTGENLGFAGGNNVGIKYVLAKNDSDYVLLLNNDTVVDPNFLNEMVKVAIKDKKIAIVGSIIADYYTEKIVFTNSKIDKKLKGKIKLDYLNSCKDYWETERVSGSSMMIKLEYILKYNLFLDENLFLYCEEIDICLRANKKHNLKIVTAGKSKIYHKEGASCGKGTDLLPIYYITRNRILLSKKLLNLKSRIIFWIYFIPSRLIRVLKWAVKGRWDLIKITYFAFKDGIQENGGKNILNF